MSSSIWTPAALSADAVFLETTAWRVVEAQHRVSTMKLVDSLEEQAVLEALLDETKPPVPQDCRHLHYLLFTPFRYAGENPYASRFRPGGSPDGVFYASAATETAIAEVTFHRLLFFAESPGTPLPANAQEFTAFAVQIRSERAIDLTRPPLDAHRAAWMQMRDYSECHRLAAAARQEGVQAISYASVRDPRHRLNYAVLTPAAFAQPFPVAQQTWRIHLRADGALAKCEAPVTGIAFTLADFAADTRLRRKALP